MSFLGTLFGELGKVALVGLDQASQSQQAKAQRAHDRKHGFGGTTSSGKKDAATTCTPCAARARVEATRPTRR